MDLSLHVIPVSQRIFKVQTERKPSFRKLPEQIYKGKITAYSGNSRHLTTCPWSLLPQPQQTSVINHFFPSLLLNLHRASWQYDNQISIIRCQETYLPPLFIFSFFASISLEKHHDRVEGAQTLDSDKPGWESGFCLLLLWANEQTYLNLFLYL